MLGRNGKKEIEGYGMTGDSFILLNDTQRKKAMIAVKSAPDGYICTIKEATRSLEQNAKMWPLLHEISEQVDWYGEKLTVEDWKDIFTASLRKSKVVPNLDSTGFVIIGQSTSRLTKSEFSDLIELIMAFGAEKGVQFAEV